MGLVFVSTPPSPVVIAPFACCIFFCLIEHILLFWLFGVHNHHEISRSFFSWGNETCSCWYHPISRRWFEHHQSECPKQNSGQERYLAFQRWDVCSWLHHLILLGWGNSSTSPKAAVYLNIRDQETVLQKENVSVPFDVVLLDAVLFQQTRKLTEIVRVAGWLLQLTTRNHTLS